MATQSPANGSPAPKKNKRSTKKRKVLTPITFSMGTAGKLSGFPYGRTKFFAYTRQKGYLLQNNQPAQKYISKGWFILVLAKPYYAKTEILVTRVTVSGVAALKQRILKDFPPCQPCI